VVIKFGLYARIMATFVFLELWEGLWSIHNKHISRDVPHNNIVAPNTRDPSVRKVGRPNIIALAVCGAQVGL